ncbi:transposase [Streptomyces xiangluensis]|uniref:Transposase n=1 Tax=Streptomyces xiangluensis TaxID=2665720 RepID=A0ABV8YGY8_9ACTN
MDNGNKWRAMPGDFPPWERVYAFFRRWRDHGLVREFHDRLRGQVREKLGRDAEPTAAVIDSQSVKADAVVGSDSRGLDGAKLVNGLKRHVVVDTPRPPPGSDGHRCGCRRLHRCEGPARAGGRRAPPVGPRLGGRRVEAGLTKRTVEWVQPSGLAVNSRIDKLIWLIDKRHPH